MAQLIENSAQLFSDLNNHELADSAQHLAALLRRDGFTRQHVIKAFALVREAAWRTVSMRHFESQIVGGLAIFYGEVAQMQTGEGKTLTATLPAAVAALGGVPVHVVTVNDYLASRDAELMGSVYELLGLSVGCIVHGLSRDDRRAVYDADIVYCTNKELVFDYLKDSIALRSNSHPLHLHCERLLGGNTLDRVLMLRGLHFAIVDEADSVLLDEARTPLVISGVGTGNDEQNEVYAQALEIAQHMREGEDYRIEYDPRRVAITRAGENVLDRRAQNLGPFWVGRARRMDVVGKALTALKLLKRDKQYIVNDDKIVIIDAHTGRTMEDRSWESGLHQLVEMKEGCSPTEVRETLAKISYQRFFSYYHHLSGMTGTATPVTKELWSIYNLNVVSIPTHRPSRRLKLQTHVLESEADKWEAVKHSVERVLAEGRAVLIGVATVGLSERLSAFLELNGVPHQLLNAKQDAQEAELIAGAGQAGAVTIATNMAGRGTDIKLQPSVEKSGGLHVILTQLHEASRIDRQLIGRCARFGDRGSFEMLLSLDDPLLESYPVAWLQMLLTSSLSSSVRSTLGFALLRFAQSRTQKRHARARRNLIKNDMKQEEMLAIAK